MNIYILSVDNEKVVNFKTYELAQLKALELLKVNPNLKIKIFEECYYSDLHESEAGCRIYLLFEN